MFLLGIGKLIILDSEPAASLAPPPLVFPEPVNIYGGSPDGAVVVAPVHTTRDTPVVSPAPQHADGHIDYLWSSALHARGTNVGDSNQVGGRAQGLGPKKKTTTGDHRQDAG